MTDHVFIVNPAAGKADRTAAIKKAVSALSVDGNVEVYHTTAPNDAVAYLTARLRDARDPVRVYACGGDGTLNEAAQGVYLSGNRSVSLGVIPVGSGNDFVRSFPVPESYFRSVARAITGKTVPCDLLLVTDDNGQERVCVNVVSAGFDAAVGKSKEQFKNLPLVNGSMAYNLSLAKHFVGKFGYPCTVLADGKPADPQENASYMFIVGANGRYYGGGFQPAPDAKTDDGLLHMVLVKKLSHLRFVQLAGAYRKGNYYDKAGDLAIHRAVRSMQLLCENPLNMNIDGEILPMQNPLVRVLPQALNLILPE